MKAPHLTHAWLRQRTGKRVPVKTKVFRYRVMNSGQVIDTIHATSEYSAGRTACKKYPGLHVQVRKCG